MAPLLSDMIRQWWDSLRLQDRMHHELPAHYREDWAALPWNRYRYMYGVLVPVIIHDALFRLHGVTITSQHRKVNTAQALVTGLFDDLFDTIHLPVDRISQLMEEPDYIISTDYVQEHLCQFLYREIHEHFTGHPRILEDSIQGIMKAQKRTSQQRNPDLRTADLLQITREKGGNGVLFYRSSLDRSIQDEERDFLIELGGLFQLTNDVNDATRDHEAGEMTVMTKGLSLREIKQIVDDQILRTRRSWAALPENRFEKSGFFDRIHILLARCLLTLDRYSNLTDPEAPFDITQIPSGKVVSGLALPSEFRQWRRLYRELEEIEKRYSSSD